VGLITCKNTDQPLSSIRQQLNEELDGVVPKSFVFLSSQSPVARKQEESITLAHVVAQNKSNLLVLRPN